MHAAMLIPSLLARKVDSNSCHNSAPPITDQWSQRSWCWKKAQWSLEKSVDGQNKQNRKGQALKNSSNHNSETTWKDLWVYQQGGGKTTSPMTPDGVSHYFVLPGAIWVPCVHADKFAMVFPTSALCSPDLWWTYWLGHFPWDSLTFICNLCSSSLVFTALAVQ